MLLFVGLSTGHKIGLAIVALVFIGFALSASFLASRRWPDFPGRNGMSVFVIACFVLFAGMLGAVLVFGRESEAKGAEPKAGGAPAHLTIHVTETDKRMHLPALSELKEGTYTFVVHNAGTQEHDFAVSGPQIPKDKTNPIPAGGTAQLKENLVVGNYSLYSTEGTDRGQGIAASISVG